VFLDLFLDFVTAVLGSFESVCSGVSLFGSKGLLCLLCCRRSCRFLDRSVLAVVSFPLPYSCKFSLIIFFCYSGFEFVRGFAR
jgi:hypothetical protein